MNKKIGIITYCDCVNYGTMLQAFALQKAIEIMGYDCDYINCKSYYDPERKIDAYKKRIFRLGFYITHIRQVFNRTLIDQKKSYFQLFFKSYFKTSKISFENYHDLMTSNIEDEYDIFITGSDQVFSAKIGLKPALFLDFVKDDNKKRAYAPSVGVTTISETDELFYRQHLKKYKYLSCREKSGANILRKYTSKEIEVVIDPTLLLPKEVWNKYSKPYVIPEPYLLCYFIGNRDYYRIYAKKLAKQMHLKLVFIPMTMNDLIDIKNLCSDCGPSEFLSLINNATFICTDSFHGTCFSINYRKDFYVFTKVKGGLDSGDNSRIYDILERLSLVDRLKTEKDAVAYKKIDYTKTEVLLADEIKHSKQYLKTILDNGSDM